MRRWANHNSLLGIFSDSHLNNLNIFVASSRPKITPKIGRLGVGTKTPKINTPKIDPGVRTPDSKSLTEAPGICMTSLVDHDVTDDAGKNPVDAVALGDDLDVDETTSQRTTVGRCPGTLDVQRGAVQRAVDARH